MSEQSHVRKKGEFARGETSWPLLKHLLAVVLISERMGKRVNGIG